MYRIVCVCVCVCMCVVSVSFVVTYPYQRFFLSQSSPLRRMFPFHPNVDRLLLSLPSFFFFSSPASPCFSGFSPTHELINLSKFRRVSLKLSWICLIMRRLITMWEQSGRIFIHFLSTGGNSAGNSPRCSSRSVYLSFCLDDKHLSFYPVFFPFFFCILIKIEYANQANFKWD